MKTKLLKKIRNRFLCELEYIKDENNIPYRQWILYDNKLKNISYVLVGQKETKYKYDRRFDNEYDYLFRVIFKRIFFFKYYYSNHQRIEMRKTNSLLKKYQNEYLYKKRNAKS